MQAITALSLLCTVLILALLWLAVYAYRTAEQARTDGYKEGYDDAERGAEAEIETQGQYIERLLARPGLALSAEDTKTLRTAIKQLLVAAQTYSNFKLGDQTRFAATTAAQVEELVERLTPIQINKVEENSPLEFTASAPVNDKSWLVHGPEMCGKTRNAQAIAKALGMTEIVDSWHPDMPAPIANALVLTNYTGPFEQFGRRVLSFDQAMSLVASRRGATA